MAQAVKHESIQQIQQAPQAGAAAQANAVTPSVAVTAPVVATPEAPAVESPEMVQLRQQLAEAELRNQTLAGENKALAARQMKGSLIGNFPRSHATTKNKAVFRFQVSVANDQTKPSMEIVACDESEAIRLYAIKAEPGKVMDTVSCSWKVECLETPKRKLKWQEVKAARLAERGHDMPVAAFVR